MTGELPKFRKDLSDVCMLGADISAYMKFWRFLEEIKDSEDMRATRVFNALDLIAEIVRKQENPND